MRKAASRRRPVRPPAPPHSAGRCGMHGPTVPPGKTGKNRSRRENPPRASALERRESTSTLERRESTDENVPAQKLGPKHLMAKVSLPSKSKCIRMHYFIGKGNNSILLLRTFKMRNGWSPASEDFAGINFIWRMYKSMSDYDRKSPPGGILINHLKFAFLRCVLLLICYQY